MLRLRRSSSRSGLTASCGRGSSGFSAFDRSLTRAALKAASF